MRSIKCFFLALSAPALFCVTAAGETAFHDITESSGLWDYYELGFGTAFVDYNGDGVQDIFVVGQGGRNRLYRNDGNNEFTDVTSEVGIRGHGSGWGVCYGDFDSDYDEDIYISRRDYDKNDLFVFTDGAYLELATPFLVDDPHGYGYSACFAPLTKSLALDLVVTNQAWPNGLRQSCRLLAGSVNQPFVDITLSAGLADSSQYWDCVACADYDNDRDLDILITGEPTNRLYRNSRHGTFIDVSDSAGINYPVDADTTGYGIAWGDYNNDGWLDYYVTCWHDQSGELFHNNGDGTFSDVTSQAHLGHEVWSHTAISGDFDNDGWLDIYTVTGGYGNKLYMNNQDGTFREVSSQAGVVDGHWCCGASAGDIDFDGKLDIVVAHYANGGDDPNKTALFQNVTDNDNNWVVIKVNGFLPNPDAIGARVRIVAGGLSQIREVTGGAGFGSQNMLPLHFGLGTANIIDSLIITFPNIQIPPLVYENVSPNRYHYLPDITLDVASVRVILPDTLTDCEQPMQSSVMVMNVGNTDVQEFKVVCTLSFDNQSVRFDSVFVPFLAAGDSLIIDFSPYLLPECRRVYTIRGIARLLGDQIPSNDTASLGLYADYSHDLACGPIVAPDPDTFEVPIVPIVCVTNLGITAESLFDVICAVVLEDTVVYEDTVSLSDTLRRSEICQVIFDEFSPPSSGLYDFCFYHLLAADRYAANDSVSVSIFLEATSSQPPSLMPHEFKLAENYPNPFNSQTRITFTLPELSYVRLEIYDVMGRRVATLADGKFEAGTHDITWNGQTENGAPLSSGIYLYRLKAGDFDQTRKMLMLK